MPLTQGQRLGPYEILSPLGTGGMGEVYQARDTRLGRRVAIKVLSPELAADLDRLERFRREAEAVAALTNPHVVTIHEVGSAILPARDADLGTGDSEASPRDGEGATPDIHYLVMELVEGRTLDRVIPARGLDLQRFFELAIPLADALAAAHEQGIVHRDIKPSNVMVSDDGRLKLLDFGLAKPRRTDGADDGTTLLTRDGIVMGTVPYMSPEQLQGQDTDHRSDIFSLGIVLYEMATGRRPFDGDSAAHWISSILRDEPRPLVSWREDMPRHVGRIVARCLEKDPRKRLQSALDVRNDLEGLRRELESEEIVARSRTMSAAMPVRERSAWPALATILVTLLVALAATVTVLGVRGRRGPAVAAPGEKVMLAVLPFDDLSAGTEQEYFSDGLTEEMIARLGTLRPESLGVIARTSVMRFKHTDKSISAIGRNLGVDYVLEGSVRLAADHVRVNAQLIQVSDQTHLWGKSYERALTDIFALQSEISQQIAESLAIELLPQQQPPDLETRRTVSPAAHEAYLRGRFQWHRRTRDSLRLASDLFEEATRLEPGYALAHAGLADTHAVFPWYDADLSLEETMATAEAAARRALELDPGLAQAHATFCQTRLLLWDWSASREAGRRAVALDPNYATAHQWYSEILALSGRFDEALEEALLGYRLDPLSPAVVHQVGLVLRYARRYEEAERYLRLATELEPGYRYAWGNLQGLLVETGRLDEARELLALMGQRFGFDAGASAAVIDALAAPSQTEAALAVLDRERRAGRDPTLLAWLYAQLGNHRQALDLLADAYEAHDLDLAWTLYAPAFDPVRADPRFLALLEELGLQAPASSP